MQTTPTHERAGDTAVPDLSGYRAAHDAFRSSTRRLVEGLRTATLGDQQRAVALRRWFSGFRGELAYHHQIEDDIYFPALAERIPAYQQYSNTVDSDHARLDAVLATVQTQLDAQVVTGGATARVAALDAATELDELMADHLDFEDADLLPLFERHFTDAEYRVLDQRALKGVSIRQALFTVPWFMATVPSDVAAQTWREAPAPLRIVHHLTRRRYDRLVVAAFGPAGPDTDRSWS